MTGEMRRWVAAVVGLGAFVALVVVVGSLGQPRPDVDPLSVEEALAGGDPAGRWGSRELHVVGWYAELDGECIGDDGGSDPEVAWLQRECPLRVLLPAQPRPDVTQRELLRDGLRLAAPAANVFPARAEPHGANLRGQQLVYVGHFDDPAAAGCVPERVERCRSTFVATDYDEQLR